MAKLGLGYLPCCEEDGATRVLFHAASVGEVTAAAPIIAHLHEQRQDVAIFLSVTTETGKQMADKIIPEASAIFFAPVDFPYAVNKMLERIKPSLLVLVETELWPNMISICHKRGIKVVLVNGRISHRSFNGYLATRYFWRNILAKIAKAGMISLADAERLALMGMGGEIQALGNAKNDSLASRVSPDIKQEIVARFSLREEDRVFIAGSTHEGEEKVVLGVLRRLLEVDANFRCIIVPRHPERALTVQKYAINAGFAETTLFSRMDALNSRSTVVVVDVIGELFKLYSVAEVVFCGGSLVPKGGQNILEAAAWGNVVFYGKYMDDFLKEKSFLEDVGVGVGIAGEDDLFEQILLLTGNRAVLAEKREKARQVVASGRGAASRHVLLLNSCLPE
ncbi:MAG: hypothetical protein K9K75_05695 [Deltaproteobacteria bacterium]|nr:hypothetical protein [Deltaproteobacteria bacterium]